MFALIAFRSFSIGSHFIYFHLQSTQLCVAAMSVCVCACVSVCALHNLIHFIIENIFYYQVGCVWSSFPEFVGPDTRRIVYPPTCLYGLLLLCIDLLHSFHEIQIPSREPNLLSTEYRALLSSQSLHTIHRIYHTQFILSILFFTAHILIFMLHVADFWSFWQVEIVFDFFLFSSHFFSYCILFWVSHSARGDLHCLF